MKQKTALVLAAGLGTRMKSALPKVLHPCAGHPIISLVIQGLIHAGVKDIRVVLGFGGETVKKYLQTRFPECCLSFYEQKKQVGTADAVKCAGLDTLKGSVIICNGDHPLIRAEDYSEAFEKSIGFDLSVVTCKIKKPAAFGRILRDSRGNIKDIREAKEASAEELRICEINTGLYVAQAEILQKYLPRIKNNNTKKEFYLTDLVRLVLDGGKKVQALLLNHARLSRGVNTPVELAQASRDLYRAVAKNLMLSGVSIECPEQTWIEPSVAIDAGAFIGPGCKIRGRTRIGSTVVLEGQNLITDTVIREGAQIRWGSILEQSHVGERAIVGPYARLRPESEIAEEVHIGNFVELKKTKMARGAKANHLTYLGDAEIGEGTNIGCGTITCNYAVDKKKYKTKIGKNVFVGSDSQFIAPVTIGDGAVIGSGSTITKDVPQKALAVARAKLFIKENYNKE